MDYENVKYNIDGIIKDKRTPQFKKEIDKSNICILIICENKFKENICNLLEYIKIYLFQNLYFQKNKINVIFTYRRYL